MVGTGSLPSGDQENIANPPELHLWTGLHAATAAARSQGISVNPSKICSFSKRDMLHEKSVPTFSHCVNPQN
jgi:hypothetical protein